MKNIKTTCFTLALLAVSLHGCRQEGASTWTEEEKEVIGQAADTKMRLYTIDNKEDSLFLRKECLPLDKKDIGTPEFERLRQRMLLTVTDPNNEGVGIAAPQVGIGRQLIAVQRMDKQGMPFEFYVNPHLTSFSEEKRIGREGCLSVPGISGKVERSEWVVLEHNDIQTYELKRDTIRGFTAVIFQHETDHLNGTLYIDKTE